MAKTSRTFILLTSPLSYFSLTLIFVFLLRIFVWATGIALPTDPSGRLGIFGQPLLVIIPFLFPIYFLVLVISTRKKHRQ